MKSAVKCPICEYENPDGQTKCRRCGTPMPESGGTPRPSGLRAGARLRQGQLLANRYYILAEIGRGGMGSIYRAKDNTLKEEVALKTLLPQFLQDKHVVERFFNEARIARQLSHPNIVRVHDIGASQGNVYISMELLHGKSLRQILEGLMPGDRLPMRTVLDIFDQLCAALEYAHRYTVHRDLKPENVMVMDDGSVKLMDFGISKLMGDANLTSASMVMGTPHYMPPEQIKHSAGVDQRADLYSLGVMLYEALTGNLPTAIHKPVSKIVRGIPPSLDPIIETCLQDDPNRRYASAGELRAALGAVREQLGLTEAPATYRPRLQARGAAIGNPRRLVGFVLLALLLAGTGVGLWRAEATRHRVLKEGLPAALPAAVTPEDRVEAPPSEPEPLDAETALGLLPLARARADSAVRSLSDGEIKTYRRGLFDQAVTWEEAAKDYHDTDAGLALPAARRALHLYMALVRWPDEAFFVPPGDSEGGVFIHARPVTAGAFGAFAEAQDWRIPPDADRLGPGDAMVYGAWYDAQAYLASQDGLNRLPTERQWSRAIDYASSNGVLRWIGEAPAEEPVETAEGESPEDEAEGPLWAPELWVEDGLLEWTRDAADGTTEPGFGVRVALRGVTNRNGAVEPLREAAPFETASNAIGFRGTEALPTTAEGIRDYLAE